MRISMDLQTKKMQPFESWSAMALLGDHGIQTKIDITTGSQRV